MDINEIIESGLLELYVLDLTSADETKQVEAWRAQHPQVNDEIAKIEETVAEYMKQFDKAPPAELKDKILVQLGIDKDNIPHRANMKVTWMRYSMVASVALLIGSVIMNLFFYNKWQTSEQQVATLEGEKQSILAEADLQKAKLQQQASDLSVLKSPSLKVVSLNSVNKGDEKVTVYWDTEENIVFVNVNNLPELPNDKQYQLWALDNGQPIDAGVMELGIENLQKLKNINNAQAFAITIEKRGGAVSPTLEQMVVLGTV